MAEDFFMQPLKGRRELAMQELADCNNLTAQFALRLSGGQIQALLERRETALRDSGRLEFGGGILKKLIYAFCDSPYLTQENYEDTLGELQDSFYYFKTESGDRIADDELIALMRHFFNDVAQGSLDYFADITLDGLTRNSRWGYGTEGGAPLEVQDE